MKKLFILFFLLLPAFIFAQSLGNLNIFSENGDKFYLFLDGKKQNDSARSNLRIQELPDLYYSARIVFEEASLSPILKNNLYVSDGNDVMRDATYRIRRERDNKARLGFYSMLPVDKNFVPGADMYVFHYGQASAFETLPVTEKTAPSPFIAAGQAPGSLNVFSQNGDKFYLFIDGKKQNDVAQSNIRISGIPGLYYNLRIVFRDPKMSPIVKNNVAITDGDERLVDAVYRIRRDNTGKPRFNFYSMTPVTENFSPSVGMWVHAFDNSDSTTGETVVAEPALKQKGAPVKGTITNIKVTEAPPSSSKPAAKSSTENTATAQKEKSSEAPLKTHDAANTIPRNKKCNGWPMGKGDLLAGKKIIDQASTEEAKLNAAQDFIVSNCLTTSQVAEFCNMFKSEKSKLAFAKYAYTFTIDRQNYAEINKALSQEKSKKELSKFINGG